MLYNLQRKKLYRRLLVGGALCVAGLGVFSCSDKYDLDTDQPSGLNSIYGYMEKKGNFKNYLQLIQDLGQKDILSKTGSKTLFIADDDAFARFFQSNKWGVKRYEDLTLAQKKLLLNTATIDNPYSTSMLSTAAGSASPIKGEVLRRSSSSSLLDSVLLVPKNDPDGILPRNASFDSMRVAMVEDTLALFTDASQAGPMVHFTAKFLSANKLASTDIDFLYNQAPGTRQVDDVYVNNSKIIDANIFCKNGFIHQVDEVIVPLDNMAEIIRKNKNMSKFSSILERFAAVADSTSLTQTYNQNRFGTDNPSLYKEDVYVKRYYSDRSAGEAPFSKDYKGRTLNSTVKLKFDPGWNAYTSGAKGKGDNDMMEDMAVMLVPSDAAIDEWWNNGSGDVIREFYGELKNVPTSTIVELLNVNQLSSFVASVPSVFADVKDDAQDAMGLTTADIDSVYLGSNGAVYLTNRVIAPKSYSSVYYPAVVDTANFTVLRDAISNLDYSSYLNSMQSKYIFVMPTNDALLTYIDPVSFGQETPQLWEFFYKASESDGRRVNVDIYQCRMNDDGTWEKVGDAVAHIEGTKANVRKTQNSIQVPDTENPLATRLINLLDNSIIVDVYQDGKKYYHTKGNTFVRLDGISIGSKVYGSLQQDRQQPITVQRSYTMQNGVSLMADAPVMGSSKSVAQVLSEHDEFSDFLSILQASGALSKNNSKDSWQASDQEFGNLFNLKKGGSVGAEDTPSSQNKATYLLNNYHYTIYAPTNDAMQQAFAAGLPTPEDKLAAEEWDETYKGLSAEEQKALRDQGFCDGDSADRVAEAMLDFIKYHIQDNSVFIDKGFESGAYPSGKTELRKSTDFAENVKSEDLAAYDIVPNTTVDNGDGTFNFEYYTKDKTTGVQLYSPGRPYKLNVSVNETSLSVTDAEGHTRHVKTDGGLYNLTANEYWAKSSSAITVPSQVPLNNSSFAVIHAIDGPLFYNAPEQFTYTYKKLTTVTN